MQIDPQLLKPETDGTPAWFQGLNNSGLYFVTSPTGEVVRFHLEFFGNRIEGGHSKPVRFGQRVVVKATLREWENRLLIDYLVSDRQSGQRLTKGTTVQVAVDMGSGEMCFVSPPVLFERLGLQRA